MIRFGIKAGLAGGAIYYLNEQGLWRESEEATKLYGKMYTFLAPYVNEAKSQIPIEVPELPKPESIPNTVANYWNKGVKFSIGFLSDLPNKTVDLAGKGIDMIKENPEMKNLLGTNIQEIKPEKK